MSITKLVISNNNNFLRGKNKQEIFLIIHQPSDFHYLLCILLLESNE